MDRPGHEPATLDEFEAAYGAVKLSDGEGYAVALKRGHAPVAFYELAWQEDLQRASGSVRRIAEESPLASCSKTLHA